ncbi:MAG: (2Fe-2S) ferredoxin domain-containing protein [Peptostreptococcales bacterium]|jgi:NADP-reducing hydrogenase subunit HndB
MNKENKETAITPRVERDRYNTEILVDLSEAALKKDAWMTHDQFAYMVGKENLHNVVVREAESLGSAEYEPIVQVNVPGKEPVLYGNITSEKIYDILDTHIKEGKVIEKWQIN